MPLVATGTAGEKEIEILLSQTRRYEKIPLHLHSIVYKPSFCVLLIEQDLLSVRSTSSVTKLSLTFTVLSKRFHFLENSHHNLNC